MDSDKFGASKQSRANESMSNKLEKTKAVSSWLVTEMDKMSAINSNSKYQAVVNSFEVVSDGIQQIKETIDPMYDHYEVLPKKIVTQNRIVDMMNLICPKRSEPLK